MPSLNFMPLEISSTALRSISLSLSLSLTLSFSAFDIFLYSLTFWHFISIFPLHNSSNTNILLLKAHLYTPFQYRTYFAMVKNIVLDFSHIRVIYIRIHILPPLTLLFMHNCSFLLLLIIFVAVWWLPLLFSSRVLWYEYSGCSKTLKP